MTNARTARNARETKAAELRAQVRRQEIRKRSAIVSVAVVAVIALVVGVGLVIQNARKTDTASATPPANLVDGGFLVGQSSAPVTVTMYEDFQCPVCKESETENGDQLAAWVADGTVKINYRMVAFLDRLSPDEYSTRSLNAAAAVVAADPTAFAAFHKTLYAEQPEENTAGLTDAQLIKAATDAGVPEASVKSAIENQTYKSWTAATTDAASKANVTGTPTIIVNGKTLADYAPATLDAAVKAAQG